MLLLVIVEFVVVVVLLHLSMQDFVPPSFLFIFFNFFYILFVCFRLR